MDAFAENHVIALPLRPRSPICISAAKRVYSRRYLYRSIDATYHDSSYFSTRTAASNGTRSARIAGSVSFEYPGQINRGD
jgi:hypothetical protein